MSFIPKLMMGLGGIGKGLTGSAGRRMVLGGAVGGIAGGISALNSDDPNQQIKSVIGGMVGGALAGAATRLVTPAIRYGKEGALTTGIPMGLKAAFKGTRFAGKVGFGAAKFAVKHPRLTLGTAGLGLGAYATSNLIGAQGSSMDQDLDDPMASNNPLGENVAMSQMNMGISPMGNMSTGTSIRASRIQQSTFGLVQGLGKGRHG